MLIEIALYTAVVFTSILVLYLVATVLMLLGDFGIDPFIWEAIV